MSGSKLAHCGLFAVALVSAGECKKMAAPGQASTTVSASAAMPSLQPSELAELLQKPGDKPLLIHVGFKKLYLQAHIPASEYLGPTSDEQVLARLKQRVANLPKSTAIVIYCGCCPWEHCPNVKPAYQALHDLGFTNAKVLFIVKDFGADWADKGYPVATGE